MTTLSAVQKMQQALQGLVDCISETRGADATKALEAARAALHSAPVQPIAQARISKLNRYDCWKTEGGTTFDVPNPDDGKFVRFTDAQEQINAAWWDGVKSAQERPSPDALITNLMEAIGYHSAQIAETKDMAPGNKLLAAVEAIRAAVSQDRPAQDSTQELALAQIGEFAGQAGMAHLSALVDELQPDAERYRFARDENDDFAICEWYGDDSIGYWRPIHPDKADQLIDAAMNSLQGKEVK